LLKIFTQQEQVLLNYLNIMANRAQLLSKKIKLLGLNNIRGKVAHFLLEQVKKQNRTDIVLKHTHEQLANMFGISRPSLTRVIREIHNNGIIHAAGKRISIMNKKALSDYLK
jgi:CRP/FNR family transcriptional regulator, dissimilatory nitrate respiration regulator